MQMHIGQKKGNLRHKISRIEAEPPKRTVYTNFYLELYFAVSHSILP